MSDSFPRRCLYGSALITTAVVPSALDGQAWIEELGCARNSGCEYRDAAHIPRSDEPPSLPQDTGKAQIVAVSSAAASMPPGRSLSSIMQPFVAQSWQQDAVQGSPTVLLTWLPQKKVAAIQATSSTAG